MAPYSQQDYPFGIMDVAELLHLRIRRTQADSVYTDCPFCGDRRGKMNINHVKNVWRCNYCGESGGMLALYARLNNTTNSDAYWEICDALQTGETSWGYGETERMIASTGDSERKPRENSRPEGISQSPRASAQEIHDTYTALLKKLILKPAHQNHLRSEKRGLTEEQIAQAGFKSTPPFYLCRSLTEHLINMGCAVQGVPGFYLHDGGYWTVNFNSITAGILIPCVGIDGLIQGIQILLDHPIKDKDAPPDKAGTKYLWLSSSTKNMGASSGSPVYFVGNPCARTVYVTEGFLKAYIAHGLMNRSFAAIAGANNTAELDVLFVALAQNGTELIMEAHDMDKYNNKTTHQGSSKIYLLAKKHGMDCRRLVWNPNYKGIDDWQLALRRKEQREKEVQLINFKEQYLLGLCSMAHMENKAQEWQDAPEGKAGLAEYLGLTGEEYTIFLRDGTDALKTLLDTKRRLQRFRLYQLDFGEEQKPIPFAFKGMDALHKAGYGQPPAAEYRLMYEGKETCPAGWTDAEILQFIRKRYSSCLPEGCQGRFLAPSDVVELYDEEKRRYYYVDTKGFEPVRFSPFLAKPMGLPEGKEDETNG